MSKDTLSKQSKNSKLWFKAKKYGWGWTPSSKEGWAVIIIYLLFLALIFKAIDNSSHSASDTLYGIAGSPPAWVLTALLIFICYKKGEKPRWRWGK